LKSRGPEELLVTPNESAIELTPTARRCIDLGKPFFCGVSSTSSVPVTLCGADRNRRAAK
jgi:hypothetical protein